MAKQVHVMMSRFYTWSSDKTLKEGGFIVGGSHASVPDTC